MIAIVTDSSSYLTKEEVKALGVKIVPINYGVGEPNLKEGIGEENHGFKELIANNPGQCKTAHASTAAFSEVFKQLIDNGFQVLAIVLSSRLSGTYSSASVAARAISPENIRVLDSLLSAGGMAILAKRAAALIKEGLSLSEVFNALENLKKKMGIAFSVDHMEPLRKSGRILAVPQSARTILNVRPILLCKEGAVIYDGVARGRHKQVKELVSRIPSDVNEVVINYIDNEENAQMLIDEIRCKFPEIKISKSPLGPVLGIHLGLGVLVVSWVCR